MDEFGDLSALIDDEPNPRDLVALLRKREALGELMAAGGPALAPQAQATLGGARSRLAAPRGESAATSLLKRTMALESIRKNQAIDAEDMAFVNTLPPDLRPLIRTKGDAAEARRGVMSGQVKAMSPSEQFDQEMTRKRLRQEEEDRKLRAAEARAAAAKQAKEGGLKTADDLRKEFNATQTAKDANAILTAYDKIEAAPPDGQGDLALITMYMRLLDPSTGVKEGEFQNAARSAGTFEQLRVMYDKVSKGELLSPETRQRFKAAGRVLRDAALKSYEKAGAPYRKIAADRGVDPNEVVFPIAPQPATKRRKYNPATGTLE